MAERKEKRYVSDNAQLMAEWDWEKNIGLDPAQLTLGSNKKVWWKCSQGHEWQISIAHRYRGHNCPSCANQRALRGYNDLQTINPNLANEWNFEKNNGLTPADVLPGSSKKVWWKCNKGHEWKATISSRNKGKGCPYCSGRFATKGVNDLQTINPSLAKEWHFEKNNGLTPADVLPNSSKIVWWRCVKGHDYQSTVSGRNNGHGCPYCSNHKVLKGYNDLQTLNPVLAKEWNYKKNKALTPADVLPGSSKKVWWTCGIGHEWQAMVLSRSRGSGCPICSGQQVLKGYNDLQTTNQSLAREWNCEKNKGLTPTNITSNSGKKVWWKCSKGHEWQATVMSRNKGSSCPICCSEQNTSFPEYVIFYYLKAANLDAIHSYKEKGYELDIYIPSRKIAIEYDGYFWHKEKAKEDLKKNSKCSSDGILLYRIREGLPTLNDSSIDYLIRKNQSDFPDILKKLLYEVTGIDVDIDLKRDTLAIENLREYTEKRNSLFLSKPEVAKEWNYEKNGVLKPEQFTANSGKKIWWKCNQGHEWQAKISHRYNGSGCPYCSGRFAIKGENDLQTINPDLANEWDYDNNAELTPMDVLPNSNKKVWWKCNQGHRWQATIASRYQGNGCPYCSKLSHSKILNVETGEVFESYSDASKKYEISVTPISNCCKGKQKTAGGYHWRFVVEE